MSITMTKTTKNELRVQLLEYRIAHHTSVEPEASQRICDQIMDLRFPAGSVISGYIPMQGEVNPLAVMTQLHTNGFVLSLPIVVAAKTPLVFRHWYPGMTLEPGGFGTQIPPSSSPVTTPDILLVPMIGFDRRCHRIGFGAGFYDRTLEQLRQHKTILAIGLAFSFQEVPEVPIVPTDQSLDLIITEREIVSQHRA